MIDVKTQLLGLDKLDVQEIKRIKEYLYFFYGECEDELEALTDDAKFGQSWPIDETLDYIPTQEIRNKVKPILRKQSRFMFGVTPTIAFKAVNDKDKNKVEDLRRYIDKIFKKNRFWPTTLKAFLASTVMKRVLLRIEANPSQPIRIIYNLATDFAYDINNKDYTQLDKIIMVSQDIDTIGKDGNEQIWYKYEYYMEEGTCMLKTSTYKGLENLEKPTSVDVVNTRLSRLPGWIILNDAMLGDTKGQSDLKDMKSMQEQYNKKVSDFSDSLRMQMFGQTVIKDATADSVNSARIAPNALVPLVSLSGKEASMQRVESGFGSAPALATYLESIDKDMHEQLSIPRPIELSAIASGKSIKFMYSELVARCEEKWNDWEPVFEELIHLIMESCKKFNCYPDWNHDWDNLDFTIVFKHNYPIPEDEADKKGLALAEIQSNVKSHKDYIKEFTDIEDVDGEWDNIMEEISDVTKAQQDQFTMAANLNLK